MLPLLLLCNFLNGILLYSTLRIELLKDMTWQTQNIPTYSLVIHLSSKKPSLRKCRLSSIRAVMGTRKRQKRGRRERRRRRGRSLLMGTPKRRDVLPCPRRRSRLGRKCKNYLFMYLFIFIFYILQVCY